MYRGAKLFCMNKPKNKYNMIKKILMAVLLLAPVSLSAQKFAHFDFNGIVQSLPETKKAMTELESMGKQYTDELQNMEKEIQTKYEKYQAETPQNTPENVRQRHMQELQDLQQRYQQAGEDNQKAYQDARINKMRPILQKVSDAVNNVAKEGNYVYILDKDAALSANIFINESLSEDVTKKVMAKLGLTALTPMTTANAEATSTPAPTAK